MAIPRTSPEALAAGVLASVEDDDGSPTKAESPTGQEEASPDGRQQQQQPSLPWKSLPFYGSTGGDDDQDKVCAFQVYNDESRGRVQVVNQSSVVFQQGSTLVVEVPEDLEGNFGVSRYMLFKETEGQCHEEALVRCVGIEERAPLPSSEDGGTGEAGRSSSCGRRACRPKATVSLSYARSMVGAFVAAVPQAKNGLLIGVGGGMIPLWVQEAMPQLQLDAVDVAPDVLAAAPCFGLPEAVDSGGTAESFLQTANGDRMASNVRLMLEDGRAFLETQPPASYDVVMLDAFTTSDEVPPCLTTVEFLQNVKARLRPGGVFVWNTWASGEGAAFLEAAGSVFLHLAVGEAPGEGNQIILASMDASPFPPEQLADSNSDSVGTGMQWYSSAQFTAIDAPASDPRRGPRQDAEWCPDHAAGASSSSPSSAAPSEGTEGQPLEEEKKMAERLKLSSEDLV